MKRPVKDEHGDEWALTEQNGVGGRNGHRSAAPETPAAHDSSSLHRLLAEKDAEIAALKQKLARYEQQAFVEGSSKALSPSKAKVMHRTPRSSRVRGRAVQNDGGPGGNRAKPMEIDGSDKEDAVGTGVLQPDFTRVHSSPPPKKKPVDLSDVIELTDSEPDVEIVAASDTSTKAKRRRKDPGETKEEVVVRSENHVLSESSRRKQRKLNHAFEISKDEKPETKPKVTEIPNEFDLKPVVTRSKKWKNEPSEKEEELQQAVVLDDAPRSGHARDDSQLSTGTQDNTVIRQLANPKAEVKKELLLKEEDLLQLLAPAALRPYPISLPERQRSATVTRDHLKERFGGNTMETFPRPNARRIAQHGYDNFMCINLLWNPHGPQLPGHGGLFFETTVWPGDPWTANPKHSAVQVLFTRLAQGKWLYLGEYELSGATPLSVEQWDGMNEANRAIWPKEIAERNWGIPVRARIHLRRSLDREPTRGEVEAAQGKFKNITVADIRAALDSGEESIQAWSMKCVGYNEDFQKDMIQLAGGR